MNERRRKPKWTQWLLLTVFFLFACSVSLRSQSSAVPETAPAKVSGNAHRSDHPSSPASTIEASSHESGEDARLSQIEEDTTKLYQLSAEFRAEVAKTYKDSLSLSVLKKAEEIEKLARSLKTLMNQESAAARK